MRIAFHRRLLLSFLIAIGLVAMSLWTMPALGTGFEPDTAGYLEFSPYRQPLYGLWANGIHKLTHTWKFVQHLQVGLYLAGSLWVVVELGLISSLGLVAGVLFSVVQLIAIRLGFMNFVGDLITEGLFFSMILLMVALFLTWQRTRSLVPLFALALMLVAMTQLRTAAMLTVILPISVATMVSMTYGWRIPAARASILVLITTFAGLIFMPALLGKRLLQISTPSSSVGIVLIARVSLLTPPADVTARSPSWTSMSTNWQRAAAGLDAVELSQFDAQLQEAVRYDIAPKILIPDLLSKSQEEVARTWLTGQLYEEARQLAMRWITNQWPEYLRLSCAHMWGLLTMANFMGNSQRAHVWQALNSIDDRTWQVAPLRTDYPLNRIYEPLSTRTAVLYAFFRYGSMLAMLVALASAIRVTIQFVRGTLVSRGSLAIVLAAGWVMLHSLPAALTVFPDMRFSYANLLALGLGFLAWLANLGPEVLRTGRIPETLPHPKC